MAELIDFGSKVQYTNESPMRWGSEQAISGANKIRDFNRQRAVEKAVSDNYNPETQKLDEQSLGKQLAGQGFGGAAEQVINQFKADRTKMSSDVADAIGKDYNLIGMRIMSPQRFIEKWGNSTEATAMVDELKSQITKAESPKPVTEPVSVIPVQTISEPPIKKTALDDLKSKFPTSFKTTPKDATSDTYVEPSSESLVVTVPGNGFVSKAEEAKLPDIIPETTYKTTTKGPSTTTGYLAIDTTPEKLASMFPDVSNDPRDIASSTFSSEGMRQDEQDNLIAFLRRGGFVQPGDTLEDSVARYENAKIDAVPMPLPAQPGKNQAEERARAAKERLEYNSKVAEAINTARKEMRDGYAEVQGTEQSKKTFESLRADMDDPKKFYGPVTPEKAKKVMDYRRYWNLFENASRSWPDAWAAAVALGKAEGNTTIENAVSTVIEMGAMPSKDAAIIKIIMSENPDILKLTANKAFDKINEILGEKGITLFKPRGANKSWANRFKGEVTQLFKDSNAHMLPFNPADPITEDSKDDPKSGARVTADGLSAKAKADAAKKPAGRKQPPRLDD